MGEIEDKNRLLLGIKYEAARIAGVEGAALEGIEEQLRGEVGQGWEKDGEVLQGRNAVRREHGLSRLGEPDSPAASSADVRRPLWRRFLGR